MMNCCLDITQFLGEEITRVLLVIIIALFFVFV